MITKIMVLKESNCRDTLQNTVNAAIIKIEESGKKVYDIDIILDSRDYMIAVIKYGY